MDSPKNLSHRSIISVNNYDKIDAQNPQQDTDVKALSIGISQYNNSEISLKIWRHTGKKWSRQSEELPLHRNIDLNILLLSALMTDVNSKYPQSVLREEIDDENAVQLIKDYYIQNECYLRPRLEELKEILNKFLK